MSGLFGTSFRVKDEGSLQGVVDTLDFVGAGVSMAVSGNTATITVAGGGSTYTAVANYSALPAANSVAAGTIYVALAGEGVWPFNRKSAGLWKSDGVSTWTHLGPMPDLLKDANFGVVNSADTTKVLQLSAANITTGTTRTLSSPDKDGTIATTKDCYPPQLGYMGF